MIGIFNIEKEIEKNISKETINMMENKALPNLDGLVLNWFPNYIDPSLLVRQAEIMSFYAKKKIPIFIYDKEMDMNYKEFNWLRKFNVSFFEPAINGRKGFSFLPSWIKILKYNDIPEDEVLTIIGYKGDLVNKILAFEKYYISYIKQFPQTKIKYFSKNLTKNKEDEYKDEGLVKEDFPWNNTAFTIAIGSQKDYRIGYLDSMVFNAMENGCLPLIPKEHRFYYGMFLYEVVKNTVDMDFFISGKIIKNIRRLLISEIYENIELYFPEFTLEFTIDKIKSVIGG